MKIFRFFFCILFLSFFQSNFCLAVLQKKIIGPALASKQNKFNDKLNVNKDDSTRKVRSNYDVIIVGGPVDDVENSISKEKLIAKAFKKVTRQGDRVTLVKTLGMSNKYNIELLKVRLLRLIQKMLKASNLQRKIILIILSEDGFYVADGALNLLESDIKNQNYNKSKVLSKIKNINEVIKYWNNPNGEDLLKKLGISLDKEWDGTISFLIQIIKSFIDAGESEGFGIFIDLENIDDYFVDLQDNIKELAHDHFKENLDTIEHILSKVVSVGAVVVQILTLVL